MLREDQLSTQIIGCAIEVHRTFGGPGLLESVYEEALVWELRQQGLLVERQIYVPIVYKGQTMAEPLRLDVLVDKLVIIEVKATIAYNSIFEAQVLTYLRLMNLKLGLVINFGEKYVKGGVHRVANNLG
jgi:GxxExxY protein